MAKQIFSIDFMAIMIITCCITTCIGWQNQYSNSQTPSTRSRKIKREIDKRLEDEGLNLRRQTRQSRIIGGRPARYGEIPYQIRLHIRGQFHCGGSILDHCGLLFILTAAHCVWEQIGNNTEQTLVPFHLVQVVAGDVNQKSYQPTEKWFSAAEIIHHPEYDIRNVTNDIAIIRLAEHMYESLGVESINLPGKGWRDPEYCRISGFGSYRFYGGPLPDDLQIVEVPILDWDECKNVPNIVESTILSHNQFCLGNKGPIYIGDCDGDSGGPAVAYNWTLQKWYLAGINSYITSFACGSPYSVTVVTKLSEYAEWIFDHADRWLNKYGTGNPYNNQSNCIPT